MGYKDEALNRAKTLLRATHDLLQKADDSPYVENVLALTINYDDAECDGSCLLEDIKYWFDEFVSEDLF